MNAGSMSLCKTNGESDKIPLRRQWQRQQQWQQQPEWQQQWQQLSQKQLLCMHVYVRVDGRPCVWLLSPGACAVYQRAVYQRSAAVVGSDTETQRVGDGVKQGGVTCSSIVVSK